MKICLITQSIQRLGGAEALVRELALGLVDRGHDVLLISIDPMQDDSVDAGPASNTLNPVHLSTRATGRYADRENHGRLFRAFWLIRCLLNDELLDELNVVIEAFKPDIIHTHKIRGYPRRLWGFLKSRFPVPLLHTCHDIELLSPVQALSTDSRSPLAKLAQAAWKGLFCRSSHIPDHVIFPSRFLQERHREGNMFRSNREAVIYNFPDMEAPLSDHLLGPLEDHEPLRLLFLGRLTRTKGVLPLCEAVRQLRSEGYHLHLTVAGEGPLEPEVREHAQGQADMEYIGMVSRPHKARLLDSCHIVVVPSDVDEAFGMVVAEAFHAARPVLASPRGALPELVEDGSTGWLMGDPSTASIAAGLKRVCALKRQLTAYSARCGKRGRMLSRDRAVDEHESIYRRARGL